MVVVEMLARYLAVLTEAWPWALLAVTVAVALAIPRVWRAANDLSAPARRALVLALVSASVALAMRMAWVCDDAFISFRYAANLAHGRGLTWNPGERVEGYTDFLWVVLLAGAIRAGLDPAQCSVVIGLCALAGTLLAAARIRAKLLDKLGPAGFPLAIAGLAFQQTLVAFGTSGLETMLATCLALWAVERALAGFPLTSSFAGILATMAHPDHGILWLALGIALALDRERRRQAVRYAVPFLLVYLPYFAARFAYYGYLLPNTYYAKSGGGMYLSQGLVYWAASFIGGGLWALVPATLVGLWRTRGTLVGRYAGLALPLYVLYVTKIGGDYMVGRLVVAILPMMFLLAELGLRAAIARHGTRMVVPACLAFAVATLPTSLVRPRAIEWNLADERTHTPLVSFAPLRIGSNMFDRAKLFETRLVKAGQKPILSDFEIGMMGYYTGLELIDLHGLTDTHVARQPLASRGRPGHERWADAAYLRARGVGLARTTLWEGRYKPVTRILLPDGSIYFFGWWQPALAQALRQIPGVSLVDAPAFIDEYLAKMDKLPATVVAEDLREFFEPYYFAANPDPARHARFTSGIAAPN
jgi:hypothetical protein